MALVAFYLKNLGLPNSQVENGYGNGKRLIFLSPPILIILMKIKDCLYVLLPKLLKYSCTQAWC